jgi:hypothetical protein
LPDEPTAQEALAAQLEEELKKLKVSDVLVQTVVTLASLGFRKLTPEDRDLDQAKLAIEALRGLLPLLTDNVPPEAARDFNQMLANLQLAYANAVSASERSDASTLPDDSGQSRDGQR